MRPEDSEANAASCLCPGCPTYDDCMRGAGQRLYCSRGRTDCTPAAKGCICGGCPVWSANGLSSYYFCMEGAAG